MAIQYTYKAATKLQKLLLSGLSIGKILVKFSQKKLIKNRYSKNFI